MLGSRDAGKGIVCDSISTAFDKYIAVFNADSLIFKTNGGNAVKKLSWEHHFDKKRLAFSNKMKVDNSIKFDGNLITKLVSGRDKILTKKQY